MEKCMPTPPKRIGREFVQKYYTIMNLSPENLHCFYNEAAHFLHDDIDPNQRRTIVADGKMAIRDVMLERMDKYKHTKTKVANVDTIETLHDGLIVQVVGEISYNEEPMRPFSQSIILVPKTPFHYFVQNDIFRFCDFELDTDEQCQSDVISDQPEPAQEDWGTQCEEYIEPYDEPNDVKQTEPRVDCVHIEADGDAHENEVKLDNSDSGLSSDAEKAIMDIQSINLKNILLEPRTVTKETVTKRGPTPPALVETEPNSESDIPTADNEITENHNQLFRDSCILTIGNVVNPNIEFDDEKRDEIVTSENEKSQESVDTLEASRNDDNNSGKNRHRKRKDKRKAKYDTSTEKSLDESNKEPEPNESPIQSVDCSIDRSVVVNEIPLPEHLTETVDDKPPESEPPKAFEQETPKTAEKISYAELAKSGKAEWVDSMAGRRDSMADRVKSRTVVPRRSSRSEKTTPSNDGNRNSPKNDLLQVFIGNIPHTATEDGIRRMFSRFGRLTRLRLHSNTRKEWLPRYAFITYDNLQSVRQCLMRKNTFYWPENSPDGQKLNVNGDPSVDTFDDTEQRKPNDPYSRSRELKQFSKNFILDSNDSSYKRSPDSEPNPDPKDGMKNENRTPSVRT